MLGQELEIAYISKIFAIRLQASFHPAPPPQTIVSRWLLFRTTLIGGGVGQNVLKQVHFATICLIQKVSWKVRAFSQPLCTEL